MQMTQKWRKKVQGKKTLEIWTIRYDYKSLLHTVLLPQNYHIIKCTFSLEIFYKFDQIVLLICTEHLDDACYRMWCSRVSTDSIVYIIWGVHEGNLDVDQYLYMYMYFMKVA